MNFCKCGCGQVCNLNYKRGCGRKGKTNSQSHNLEKIKEKDKIREQELEESGYMLMRFWEDEVTPYNVSQRINLLKKIIV